MCLEWKVVSEAQKEYIKHLAFLLESHIDKLHKESISKIQALPGECSVMVEHKPHHASKVVPPPTHKEIMANGIELGNQVEVDVGEVSSV